MLLSPTYEEIRNTFINHIANLDDEFLKKNHCMYVRTRRKMPYGVDKVINKLRKIKKIT